MSRIACVNIPSLSLQLLSQKEPDWFTFPLAVVTEEKPTGIILELNRQAKHLGVRTGMRFSAALTLAPNLHAAAVSDSEISSGIEKLLNLLLNLSPEIEPFDLCPGIFWINAIGFDRLFGNNENWARSLQKLLEDHGFISRISIGFTRFGTFLAAKQCKEPIIFADPAEEIQYARYTPLTLLPMPPKASAQLENLGVRTIGAFIDLPPGGVSKRFPKNVANWYQFASSKEKHPIQPVEMREDLVLIHNLQPEAKTLSPVLLQFRELLDHLLADVMKHNEFVHSLKFTIGLEDGSVIREILSPSKPTVRSDTLYRLLTLRLVGVKLNCPVGRIEISAERVEQKSSQELLFQESQHRNREEGAKAFALIRAELGNNAVQYAHSTNEHLPEEKIQWKNESGSDITIQEDQSQTEEKPLSLVRRMYQSCGEVKNVTSLFRKSHARPVRVTTGWWERPISRDYHFIEDTNGYIHWTYKDHESGTWFFQGYVS